MLWGTLLIGATFVRAVEGGLRPALHALVPQGEGAAWGWTNLLAVVVALVAWPSALSIFFRLRRPR